MRRRPILLLVLALALLLGIVTVVLFITRTARQEADFAALESALGGRYVVMETYSTRLPQPIAAKIWDWLMGHDPFASPDSWRQHVAGYLRGPIESITLDGKGPLDESVSAALARFTNLQRLALSQSGDDPLQVSAIEQICAIARKLPKLDTLEIYCSEISDTSLEPLRGHSSLREIGIYARKGFTVRSIEPLRTLPALQELSLGLIGAEPTASSETQKAITATLPTVTVTFH